MPLLSILIPVLEQRDSRELYHSLSTQMIPFGDQVELLIEADGGERTSGIKRNALVARSQGKYRCFVDDDDMVADDYVAKLMEGCRSGADVVTFSLRLARKDRPHRRPEVWKFGPYKNMRAMGLMAANHLCAWKRSIADKIGWCPFLGCSDDRLWFQPLHAVGAIRTVWSINEVMYHYDFSPTVTRNQRTDKVEFSRRYVGSGLDCYHAPDGSIFVRNGQVKARGGMVSVYDAAGKVRDIPDSTPKFYTITLE